MVDFEMQKVSEWGNRMVFLENGPFLDDLWWFTYEKHGDLSQFSQTVS